ncbi:MAG: hypothetical protein ACTSWQ_03145 [Candidatus Thorarchaeota archaeon]
MDKKQRSEIVTVKLKEVLIDEQKKIDILNKTELDGYMNLEVVKELQDMKKKYDKMQDDWKSYQDNINHRVTEILAEGNIPVNINHNFYYSNDSLNMSIELKDMKHLGPDTSAAYIKPNDIVTYVTALRNHDNARIQKVAREGYELVVEDNEEKLKLFLEL